VLDGYELVAFDLPAANGYPATIGWELFGGLEYMTLVASGPVLFLRVVNCGHHPSM
jgi:hypothetical protein